MDQIRRFFKEAATYTIFDFFRRLLGFFLIPFYTRVLTPTEYGTFFIINLVLGFLAIGYNLGLMVALYRFQPKRDDAFSNGMSFLIPYTAILSLAFILLSRSFADFFLHDQTLSYLFQIGIIFLFFEGILSQILALIKIERKPTQFGIISTLRFASGLLLNILFVVFLRHGVAGILIGNALAAIGIGLFAFYQIRSYFARRFDRNLLMQQLSYGLPLLPALFAFLLIDFIDRFMIERFINLAKVGIYSLAYQFGAVMNLVILGYRTAYAPFFFSLPKEQHGELGHAFRYFILTVGFLYTAWILLLPEVFRIFVGGGFHSAINLIWIIALGFFAYGIYINFASHLYLRNQTGLVSVLASLALLINIIGNLFLIPRFGIYGAAWATMIAYAMLALFAYLITRPEDYDLGTFLEVVLYVIAISIINLLHPSFLIRLFMIIGYPVFILALEKDLRKRLFFTD